MSCQLVQGKAAYIKPFSPRAMLASRSEYQDWSAAHLAIRPRVINDVSWIGCAFIDTSFSIRRNAAIFSSFASMSMQDFKERLHDGQH